MLVLEGVRPDALCGRGCPNIQGMMREGSYTMSARTVFPSLCMPTQISMMFSMPPIEHLVTDDLVRPSTALRSGFIDVLSRAGLKSGGFYSNEALRYLSRPGSLAFSYFRNGNFFDGDVDIDLVSNALKWAHAEKPAFLYLCLSGADATGHQFGWMSKEYCDQIEVIDRAVGLLMDNLPSESTILLTSNHGGHAFEHGTKLPEDISIPWIIRGPGTRSAYQITRQVSCLDSIPTLAALMGVKAHPQWRGSVVTEVFEMRTTETLRPAGVMEARH